MTITSCHRGFRIIAELNPGVLTLFKAEICSWTFSRTPLPKCSLGNSVLVPASWFLSAEPKHNLKIYAESVHFSENNSQSSVLYTVTDNPHKQTTWISCWIWKKRKKKQSAVALVPMQLPPKADVCLACLLGTRLAYSGLKYPRFLAGNIIWLHLGRRGWSPDPGEAKKDA